MRKLCYTSKRFILTEDIFKRSCLLVYLPFTETDSGIYYFSGEIKMIKRMTALILAAVMVIGLAGCKQKENKQTSSW